MLDKFIALQTASRRYQIPTREDVDALVQWHRSYRDCAIDREEQAYLTAGTDLLRVVPREEHPLRRMIKRAPRLNTFGFWKDKQRKQQDKSFPERLKRDDGWTDVTMSLATMTAGGVMLVAPLWILRIFDSARERLAVVTAFLGVVLLMLSILLPGKPLVTLGAAAV